MKLSPLLSVQDFAQLRAACSQPEALAFQQLLQLPCSKRRLFARVERKRSAEQWAELAKVNQNKQWNKKSKQKIVYNLLGGKHHFTPTGSVFDGWKEYLLCTSIVHMQVALFVSELLVAEHQLFGYISATLRLSYL